MRACLLRARDLQAQHVSLRAGHLGHRLWDGDSRCSCSQPRRARAAPSWARCPIWMAFDDARHTRAYAAFAGQQTAQDLCVSPAAALQRVARGTLSAHWPLGPVVPLLAGCEAAPLAAALAVPHSRPSRGRLLFGACVSVPRLLRLRVRAVLARGARPSVPARGDGLCAHDAPVVQPEQGRQPPARDDQR